MLFLPLYDCVILLPGARILPLESVPQDPVENDTFTDFQRFLNVAVVQNYL